MLSSIYMRVQSVRLISGKTVSGLIIVLLMMFALALGMVNGGTALHDPDTCWLLALGRWIFEHGGLPHGDPFSYTQALTGQEPILYQWLSELTFYGLVKMAGTPGLLAFTSAVLAVSFIAWPVSWLWKTDMRRLTVLSLMVLSTVAASVHFLARPEIFSFLLLAVCVELGSALSYAKSANSWRHLLAIFLLLAVWCNLHSGFVLGIMYLSLLWVAAVLGRWFNKPQLGQLLSLSLAVLSAVLGSFINPWGMGLWQYLPRLFFSPINAYINELHPLSWSNLLEFTYYPFLFLAAAIAWQAVRYKKVSPAALTGGILTVVAVISGIICRRLIPFSVLFLLAAVRYQRPATASSVDTIADSLDARFNPNKPQWPVSIAALAALGAVLSVLFLQVVEVPQGSVAFQPPLAAVDYLRRHQFSGHLLNDPQYGDVLIWNLPKPPLVFIDTRYDMYGEKILFDYQQMVHCHGDWSNLLKQYAIEWVFLPVNLELSQRLAQSDSWSTQYADKQSVILSKNAKRIP